MLVSAWAYAYEVESNPIVDDATYDREARLIRPELSTGHDVLDAFFRTEFDACTGSWINCHPEKQKMQGFCARLRAAHAAT